jgi:hypothetical protein
VKPAARRLANQPQPGSCLPLKILEGNRVSPARPARRPVRCSEEVDPQQRLFGAAGDSCAQIAQLCVQHSRRRRISVAEQNGSS